MESKLLEDVPLLTKAISLADTFAGGLGRFDRLGFMRALDVQRCVAEDELR